MQRDGPRPPHRHLFAGLHPLRDDRGQAAVSSAESPMATMLKHVRAKVLTRAQRLAVHRQAAPAGAPQGPHQADPERRPVRRTRRSGDRGRARRRGRPRRPHPRAQQPAHRAVRGGRHAAAGHDERRPAAAGVEPQPVYRHRRRRRRAAGGDRADLRAAATGAPATTRRPRSRRRRRSRNRLRGPAEEPRHHPGQLEGASVHVDGEFQCKSPCEITVPVCGDERRGERGEGGGATTARTRSG